MVSPTNNTSEGMGENQSSLPQVPLDPTIDFSSSEDEGDTKQSTEHANYIANLKKKQNEEFENKLQHILNNPNLWDHPDNQFLREFCNRIESNRQQYPCVPGDSCYEQAVSVSVRSQQKELTKGYTDYNDTSFVSQPVLYVLSRTTKHEDQTFAGFSDSRHPPPVKTTHLCLMDGDGNKMLGRLSEIADRGKGLNREDIIRLDLCVNDKTAPLSAVFVLKYTTIGYSGTAPPAEVSDKAIPFNTTTKPRSPKKTKISDTVDRLDAPVNCCPTNRYCSMHGVSFSVCVCESIPVEKLDLAAMKEDCYFATDELNKMSNSHKRNMIYWLYTTNVYSICGKGKRKQLPTCLVHKIRQCYPSDEFSGFELSSNLHNQH